MRKLPQQDQPIADPPQVFSPKHEADEGATNGSSTRSGYIPKVPADDSQYGQPIYSHTPVTLPPPLRDFPWLRHLGALAEVDPTEYLGLPLVTFRESPRRSHSIVLRVRHNALKAHKHFQEGGLAVAAEFFFILCDRMVCCAILSQHVDKPGLARGGEIRKVIQRRIGLQIKGGWIQLLTQSVDAMTLVQQKKKGTIRYLKQTNSQFFSARGTRTWWARL